VKRKETSAQAEAKTVRGSGDRGLHVRKVALYRDKHHRTQSRSEWKQLLAQTIAQTVAQNTRSNTTYKNPFLRTQPNTSRQNNQTTLCIHRRLCQGGWREFKHDCKNKAVLCSTLKKVTLSFLSLLFFFFFFSLSSSFLSNST
jgi:hypothetical protein